MFQSQSQAMVFIRVLTILLVVPFTEEQIYLSATEDGSSLEFYDCVSVSEFQFCRRPSASIDLDRDDSTRSCEHDGIRHSFASLSSKDVSISTLLHHWSSSVELAEEYSRYLQAPSPSEIEHERSLCQCTNPRSFGKHCEYLRPKNETFPTRFGYEAKLDTILKESETVQVHIDLVCYTTLICDSGLLCLDWREICDGLQQCMFGYDEENCDKLEFNECEEEEYRCLNGMCIPGEYFVDGDYDCADLTDEKQLFDEKKCPDDTVSLVCDDRPCPPNSWSCGDGQFLLDRLSFETDWTIQRSCASRRDQYFMCERNVFIRQWTLPNGRCFKPSTLHSVTIHEQGTIDTCEYFVKCALSQGLDENCPCGQDMACVNELENPCDSLTVQYPKGAVLAPYIFHLYNTDRDWSENRPDWLVINGTIKCRGYLLTQSLVLPHPSHFSLRAIEQLLCNATVGSTMDTDRGYDRFCANQSRTFNNRSYHFIDVCEKSRECISAYRIADGYQDCADGLDENRTDLVSTSCFPIRRHRFRCSTEKTTCLPVNQLSHFASKCQNIDGGSSMSSEVPLVRLRCYRASRVDCQLIRQRIEASWTDRLPEARVTRSIPFRAYCDTVWDLAGHADENLGMCLSSWVCHDEQWRCRSGQCINLNFVLDREWDCSDGSDEVGIFIGDNAFAPRNIKLISESQIRFAFARAYEDRPFLSMCNVSSEFSCYRIGASSHAHDQVCISGAKLGDGVIDCMGGVDERNTLEHCDQSKSLGENYKCLTSDTCIAYADVCDIRCPNRSDDQTVCPSLQAEPECSASAMDFVCWNGECVKNGWCDMENDCLYGEDEYLCSSWSRPLLYADRIFLDEFKIQGRGEHYSFQFPDIPISTSHGQGAVGTPRSSFNAPDTSESIDSLSPVTYLCHRGVGILMSNDSVVCFCPPQYYGDNCQFHNDRVTLLLQLNFSQSIYEDCKDPSIELKLLVLFLDERQTLQTYEFPVRPALTTNVSPKRITHVLYSRSNQSLERKRQRYFNRASLSNEHPYSVRVEAYELKIHQEVQLVALWQYPIHFDFLPNYRLAKVLSLSQAKIGSNPCSSNPCNQYQTCHQLLNQNASYVCLCQGNRRGEDCEIVDRRCLEGFCSSNGLCKPDYRSLLQGNTLPYCLCSKNTHGRRCHLPRDHCRSNPCLNNGSCYPTETFNGYQCVCDSLHNVLDCGRALEALNFVINETMEHQGAVVQLLYIDCRSSILRLGHQQAFLHLPAQLHFLQGSVCRSELTLVKSYLEAQAMGIYLISSHNRMVSLNATIQLNEKLRCVDVQTLFNASEGKRSVPEIELDCLPSEIVPFNYHSRCIANTSLLCFFDDTYLCVCNKHHSRVECANYDHSLDQCSACSINGFCLAGDRSQPKDFVCVCRRCHYGHLCQYSTEELSFTLDSLIVPNHFKIRLLYLTMAALIFLVGGMTNYASFVTFKRPTPRKVGVGNYLLIMSLANQCSLFFLLSKVNLILFASFSGDIPCKVSSYFLSVSTRYSYWLTSWVTIDRVHMTVLPFSAMRKKPRSALLISFLSFLVIASMHVHELLFYVSLEDPSGQTVCVTTMATGMSLYNRITVLMHFIVPFGIQLVSITLLIVFAARSRSRAAAKETSFVQQLRHQLQSQKELYLTPVIIVLSGLPQAILSFSLACTDWSLWQRHTLLGAYFLSFAPQVLGFVLFVLPSTSYLKEFREAKLAQMFLYRWTLAKKKPAALLPKP